ncbi:Outer membrane protein TolC [Cyclobacterium xiamenense]|uniref:Outer membrane protein TolC n=1 Tax=Cyclobacterium xiamenense TaxID=1297121 RepID=A0A1H6TPW0_9BACT|nr:TolC family protein [Cyclobacterium xiamenense]SEI79257.1 Outer membrane protein TolC [Cyclobacterium xiamenense]
MEKPISLGPLKFISIILTVVFFFEANGQQTFKVGIVSDGAKQGEHLFEGVIKAEISALLSSRYDLSFTEVYTNGNLIEINDEIGAIYAKKQVDVLVGVGVLSSKIISNQRVFPIPSIASIQLFNEDSTNLLLPNARSGIFNYTYIKSPFDIVAGINTLKEICRCSKLAILTHFNLSTLGFSGEDIQIPADTEIEWISLETVLENTVAKIPEDVGGVYILSPLTTYSSKEIEEFFAQLIERKLPSFSMLDVPMLQQGAYAAFAVSDNINKIPRRIAINIEKIAGGENPKDLPVNMESFSNQLVINMETVNKTAKYPNWTLLDNALLVNINRPNTPRILTLKGAIAEGIENNLGYQIEAKQTQINAKDVSLAKSNYLPQLNVESTGFSLDENTVNSSFGTLGSFNWTAGASFSQLIFSEPAMANIAIQKLLFESQRQAQKQSELDVILEVAQRYFTYMQASAVFDLQNNNIRAVNQNLAIAKNKEKVGYSGSSDVYRWQTELDLAKTELYATNAQLKAAGYQLNETLNRPIGDVFSVESSENISQYIEEVTPVFLTLIQDQASFNQFVDFLVNEAQQNLPELQQIQLAIAAQERLLKSNRRSFYMPTLALGAGYDYPIKTVNPGDPLPLPGVEINNLPTWNAGVNVSIPLFAGGSRKYEKQKTKVSLYQLKDQQSDVNNLLELQVRANMEQVNASYNNIRLTKSAAASAENNIEIVRNLYQSGQVDIITLVDAQHSLLGAQLNATNAAYQFMLDFFALQRSIGNYTFLATEAQRAEFLQRFLNFKTN